jgi:hypothetical protein
MLMPNGHCTRLVDPRLVHWGYAAEDFGEVEVGEGDEKRLTHQPRSGAELKPDGVTYDRLTVLLLSLVQREDKAIAELRAKVSALEAG